MPGFSGGAESIEEELPALAAMQLYVEGFDFFARPGRLAQKGQAGLDARVALEAANVDALGQTGPFIVLDQSPENLLEGDAVQRIGIGCCHDEP